MQPPPMAQWQYTPYELPLLLAAAVSVAVALAVWRRRAAPGTAPLLVLMSGTAWWSLAYAVQLASATLPAQHFWDNVAYIGVVVVAPAWLIFALDYSGRGRLARHAAAVLAVPALLTLLAVWTNGASDPFLTRVWLAAPQGYVVLAATAGPLFWLVLAYGYLVVLTGTLLLTPLFSGIRHPNRFYRAQALLLLISVAAPWAANIITLSGHSPFGRVDLTPFAFTIGGAAMAWALLGFRLLNVVPVARASVVDSMSEIVLVLDEQGHLLDLNAAARAAFSLTDSAALGKPLDALFAPGAELLRHCASAPSGPLACTERTLRDPASGRTFEARVTPLRHRSGHLGGHLLVLDDVTARVQAEEALRASEERLRQAFEAAPIGVLLLDLDGRILQVNRAFRDLIGYGRAELLGRTLADFTHLEDVGKGARLAASALAGALTSYKVEQRFLKKSRDLLWAELTMTLIRAGDDAAYRLAMIENIFERKRAELLEDEQRHVAYELHDGLAQVAAGAHLHLQAFAGHFRPHSAQARAELDRALDLAQRAAREARRVIAGLRPTVVEELGLATALRIHVEGLRADGWEIGYDEAYGPERCPPAVETALFRVALEALNNTRKHAGTTRAHLALTRTPHAVCLEVGDCGCGFDASAPRTAAAVGHIGLREMQDRITLLGGAFTLESRPGAGTHIRAEIPLSAADETNAAHAAARLAAAEHAAYVDQTNADAGALPIHPWGAGVAVSRPIRAVRAVRAARTESMGDSEGAADEHDRQDPAAVRRDADDAARP